MVAVSDARRHCKSGLQLLPVTTLDVTPPLFLTSATASNVQESNFTLTVSLNEPGMLNMLGMLSCLSAAMGACVLELK